MNRHYTAHLGPKLRRRPPPPCPASQPPRRPAGRAWAPGMHIARSRDSRRWPQSALPRQVPTCAHRCRSQGIARRRSLPPLAWRLRL
jgi:hypothetical protein